jgi:hypothetical protein
VTQAPAKAGWAIGMVRIFKKIFVGKDPKMTVLEAGPELAPRQTFDVPPQVYPRGRWTVFKNPFAKRGKPVDSVAPVQGELLLDLVKPIRNDLSDSDLEVIPAVQESVVTKTPPDAGLLPRPEDMAPAVSSSEEMEPVRADWARMKDQFFGVEKL